MIHALKRNIIKWCFTLVSIAACHTAAAQYYSWGSDPASLKWNRITTDYVELIYPDTVDYVARRTLHYIDAVKGSIDYGYSYPALDIPFVLHPENMASNGLVMWMPKRIEILNTPATESYSMLWMKQLVAHEYRHAVQYNNLSQGVIRWLKYVLGDQGAAVGLALMPVYIIEGDAVMNETQMSSFGRGVQPSFTMEYRAIGREILERRNFDRWICGSYLSNTPDHYHFGYQIASYTYRRYNKNIWNDVANYAVRRPYMLFTTNLALKKYYDTNMSNIFFETFGELNDYWESLPQRHNSMEIVTPIDTTNYTTYSHPLTVEGGKRIVALKKDYARPSRFVELTPQGDERHISYTGVVSTRPTEGGGRVWWSEYRFSSLYSQRVSSRLCYMDLANGKQHEVKGLESTLYPTAIANTDSRLAYVEYNINGEYSIVEVELNPDIRAPRRAHEFKEIRRTTIARPTEIHGLAWDDKSEELYFIATDDSGMWLGVRDGESYRQLRQGAYITLSDLRARGGKLYYGSIESGYDELHSYDIASGREERLSESEYGSFDASAPAHGYMYGTTYDKYGYHLSRQSDTTSHGEVTPTRLPQNIVNPAQPKWDVVNLDSVSYTPNDNQQSHVAHPSRRYRKVANLIDVHSWMPIVLNPLSISGEQFTDPTFGATVVSQNLLSSCEGFLSAGYDFKEGFIANSGLYYTGLGLKIGGELTYGGHQLLYMPTQSYIVAEKGYFSAEGSVTLPLLLRDGYHKGQLNLSTAWNYANSYVADIDNMSFDTATNEWQTPFYKGLHKLSVNASYTGWVSSAVRDAYSPLSYSVSAGYALSPSDRNFGDLVSIYSHITTRGLLPHNTITLAANYQQTIGGVNTNGVEAMMFRSVSLLPKGFGFNDVENHNYLATSLNYQLPILYPQMGLSSILYLSRIRLSLGGDYAQFRTSGGGHKSIYSYGGSLIFDISPLRLPQAGSTTAHMTVRRKSNNTWYISGGIDLPL